MQGGSPQSRPGPSCSLFFVCGCLPLSLGFPLDKGGGRPDPLHADILLSGPAHKQGLEWGPCSTLSCWRCQGVWGSQPLVCSVSGNGMSARGPGGGWGEALRAAVSEGLVPSSQGSEGSIFQPLLGPTSCLGEKTERPLAGNGLLPAAPCPMALAYGERPTGRGGSPWLGVPNSIRSPWSAGGDRGLPVMTATPTLQASLV